MLFKIVLGEQIRIFDSKGRASLSELHLFIGKIFPQVARYRLWYSDEDGDQISLDSENDLFLYLEICKKPKIFIKEVQSQSEILGNNETPFIRSQLLAQEEVQELQKQGDKRQFERTIIEQDKKQHQFKKQDVEQKELLDKQQKNGVKQKRHGEVHRVKCDGCGISPIINIRYLCGVCPNYNLCSNCQEDIRHNHPLIKIREVSQTPTKVVFQFSHNAQQIKEKVLPQSVLTDQIIFQDEEQRKQLIISYLSNLLGDQSDKDFQNYRNFAQSSESKYYDSLVEDYLLWQQCKEGKKSGLLEWVKKRVAGMFVGVEPMKQDE